MSAMNNFRAVSIDTCLNTLEKEWYVIERKFWYYPFKWFRVDTKGNRDNNAIYLSKTELIDACNILEHNLTRRRHGSR